MAMRRWRLRKEGTPNLGCLLLRHHFCDQHCAEGGCTIYGYPAIGHCFDCGAIIECSDNVRLPTIDAYGNEGG